MLLLKATVWKLIHHNSFIKVIAGSQAEQIYLYALPGYFILFNINHGVFDCLVHKRVHTGDEEVDGTQQCLSIFGQKLLGVSIVTKLLLKKTIKHKYRSISGY